MAQTDVVSISDIHIGNNTTACWYNNGFHDGYLKRVLEYVISNADDLKEFIILGDLFDFWTYAPGVTPPTVEEIITANTGTPENPGIFGIGNMLDTAVTAMGGRVSYVVGNHDITITQPDLDKIPLSNGYKITRKHDSYSIGKTLFTHGHIFTIFNAPDPANPIPLGHFVTRLIAYYVEHPPKGPVIPAWKMTGQGAPASRNIIWSKAFGPALLFLIKLFTPGYKFGPSTVSDFVDIWVKTVKFPTDGVFKMASGPDMTIAEIKHNYGNLFSTWDANHNKEYVRKSVYTDGVARSMSWFTQQAALESNADLVVTGHTHWPTLGVTALADDVNCGFECFPEPAINTERFTFARIANVDTDPVPTIYQITKGPNDGYLCKEATGIPKGDINFKPLTLGPLEPKDFSCFVRVINNSASALAFDSRSNTHGKWTVDPNTVLTIPAGGATGFWIQDYGGIFGSDGTVKYTSGSTVYTLAFNCPLAGLLPINSVTVTGSGAPNVTYRTKVGTGAWQAGTVDKLGHPLCVEFTIT